MSEKREDGGPAFPVSWKSEYSPNNIIKEQVVGMTLRDYFAARALPIIIDHDSKESGAWDDYAQQAYEMADAMIAERKK